MVFAVSASAVVAADTGDDAQALEISDDDALEVQNEETLSASDSEDLAAASEDNATSSNDDDITSLSVIVSTDKEKYNVGDRVTVYVDIMNVDNAYARSVRVVVTVPDNLKYVGKGSDLFEVTKISENKFAIDFGTLDYEDEGYMELYFIATAPGKAEITSEITGEDFILAPGCQLNTTITIEGNNTPNNGNNVQKTMPAAGNPILLLALALCCLIPVYRRK